MLRAARARLAEPSTWAGIRVCLTLAAELGPAVLRAARARLAEPSTWAGIRVCLTLAADAWTNPTPERVGAFVAGLVAIIRAERPAP